jgi:predicted ATP-grasp superfamily ATP-dependent carboligase
MAHKSKETTTERIARKAEELRQKIQEMRKRMERESDSE